MRGRGVRRLRRGGSRGSGMCRRCDVGGRDGDSGRRVVIIVVALLTVLAVVVVVISRGGGRGNSCGRGHRGRRRIVIAVSIVISRRGDGRGRLRNDRRRGSSCGRRAVGGAVAEALVFLLR